MSQYSFNTRILGPNALNRALTLEELDNSLLFLSSSLSASLDDFPALSQSVVDLTAEVLILSQSINEIEFHPLSGSNYIFVEANGTPTQNANYLTASYNLAKSTNLTGSDRFSVLLGPGKYEFVNNFIIDTPYIDVVSLTGDRDIYFTGSTIEISADNVYIRGIDVGTNNFTITSSFPGVIIKNCKGGDESFGGDSTTSSSYVIGSTFIDCEGGDYSFAGGAGLAYGTFINCIGGDYSFGQYCDGTFTNCVGGDYSFAYQGDIQDGIFENCTGGNNSFASLNNLEPGAILRNCIGGSDSFMKGGTLIEGLLQGCKLTSGNFSSQVLAVLGGGIRDCVNSNNTTANS
jgi:hypothetical protein